MSGARLALRGPDGPLECTTRLPGAHNASNVAAAFAIGHSLGVPPGTVTGAVQQASAPPGRWELIDGPQPFDVLVDYAHTPDGIRRALEAVRGALDERGGGALHTVFGAVGVTERRKGLESGAWAGALSDHLILTTGSTDAARIPRLVELRRGAGAPPTDPIASDPLASDPRTDRPTDPPNDPLATVPPVTATNGSRVEVVLDRRAAIRRAIEAARPGDVVAVLGIGPLRSLGLDAAGTTWPHDDREAARDALRSASTSASASGAARPQHKVPRPQWS
jgi:UDP-N-acetylmuramoyl-L-alanyl-D-glutamate--2,6-diaminopimelate ligase